MNWFKFDGSEKEGDELHHLLSKSRHGRESEIIQQRHQALADIEAAETEIATLHPTLAAAVEKAAARLKAAEEELEAASVAHRVAVHQDLTACIPFSARITQAQALLVKTADPHVDMFIREIDEIIEKSRKEFVASEWTTLNFDQQKFHVLDTNGPAVEARIEKLRSIRDRAEALKFKSVEVYAGPAIEVLRAEIPDEPVLMERFETPFAPTFR